MIRILMVLSLVLSNVAIADTQLSLMGSLLYNTSETDSLDGVSGIDEEPGIGFGLGMRALMGINDQLHFRSGAGLVQRNFSYETTGSGSEEVELSFTYLVVPLTLYWKASSQVGFFGGTALNARLDDDCDPSDACSIDAETLVFPAIIGFDFSFTERLGMEVSYEHALTDAAKGLKVNSAVVSLLYHFE